MRHIIILTDEDLNDLINNKMVQCPVHLLPSEPTPIYLTTQKGYEIDLAGGGSHGCDTCKYNRKMITEEPCSSCDICLGNNKWESNDSDGGDK